MHNGHLSYWPKGLSRRVTEPASSLYDNLAISAQRFPDKARRLVSINSALEIDLTGQVNAESIGTEHVGAVGGQVDYVRAAAQADDGVSIIAMTSVDKHGRSKIVPKLSGPVTTPRSDVELVATEHGIARLSGLSL